MAKQVSTLDRAAECDGCGHTAARHVWGTERAMLSGPGCDGWKEGVAPAAPSGDPDLYRIVGPDNGPHQMVEFTIGQRDEAGTVKARLDAALTAQCGHRHWVSARRINRRGTVLDWRVTAYCWPEGYAPATRKQMADECDGIDGLLTPADRAATEAAHQARLDMAAELAGDIVLRSRGLVS